MSTRSRIGIIREHGETPIVESIYCHFDGYPEGVGKTLLEHWTTEEKVNELIALGDLSSLGEEIGEDQGTDWFDKKYEILRDPQTPLDDPRFGWCVAYGRDRGEKDVRPVTHPIDSFPDYGQEAEYVFDPRDGTWRVRSEMLNPVGWNTVPQWEGWITIPEALEFVEQEA